ncbi:M12 family metallo-peptidase [Streptomyces monticola]|uniref:M12 family metallo-peptidase n=1 Tax=Streptomyces monticola TaxID=2666263 RepID=A0ABW2JRV7_9ACTN
MAALLLATPLASPVRSHAATAAGPDPDRPWVTRTTTVDLVPAHFRHLCERPQTGEPEVLTLSPFPYEVMAQVVADSSYDNGKGTIDWTGHELGRTDRRWQLHVTNACDGGPISMSGSADMGRFVYHARPVKGQPGKARFEEVDTTKLPDEPVEIDDAADSPVKHGGQTGTQGIARAAGAPGQDATPEDPAVVDVIVGFTPKGADAALRDGSSLEEVGSRIESMMNHSLADSDVPARIDVVLTHEFPEYSGLEAVIPIRNRVSELNNPELGKYAAKLRDQHGADLVHVISGTNRADFAAGVAKNGLTGFNVLGPGTADVGWHTSATHYEAMKSKYTSSHEMGHSLGLAHDRRTLVRNSSGGGISKKVSKLYPYNTGWIAPNEKWVTIMAYPSSCHGPCIRIPRFSNKAQKYDDGQPLGNERSDAAAILRMTTPQVATYRTPRTPRTRYALNLTPSPKAGGTVQPEVWGPYRPNTRVTITATPKDDYVVGGWTLNGKRHQATSTSLAVTMDKAQDLAVAFRKCTSPVRGAFRPLWLTHEGVKDQLRCARGAQRRTPGNTGWYQRFDGGYMYWSRGTGAHAVHGTFLKAWQKSGQVRGRLGFPSSEETPSADGKSVVQKFRGGTLTQDTATGKVTATYGK